MSKSVFERQEKKYIVNREQFSSMMKYIDANCVPDEYPESDVCSIYYDTPDSRIIRASIDKPMYKEKLRMRSYGVPAADTKVFIEIKKKFCGVVYKRRVRMRYSDAVAYLEKRAPAPKPCQITREIDYFMSFYPGLKPAMFISYHRLSYLDKNDPMLRITFDNRVTVRDTALSLDAGIWGRQILEEGLYLMEVKTAGAMPMWLADALDCSSVFPASFSKYGTAYTDKLAEQLNPQNFITEKGELHFA